MRTMIILFLLIMIHVFTGLSAGTADRPNRAFKKLTILPTDDSATDGSFLIVTKHLKKIVKTRDTQGLLKILHPNAKLDFGGSSGKAGLIRLWSLNKRPELSEIWTILEQMLNLGCSRQSYPGTGTFYYTYPSISARFPHNGPQFESVDQAIVTGNNVNVRTLPSINAQIMDRVSYNVLLLLLRDASTMYISKNDIVNGIKSKWYKVRLHTGKTGYIFGQFLYFRSGYRMNLEKDATGWRITALLGGI